MCDALRDLVPFVKFKKREKHPWTTVNTLPWVNIFILKTIYLIFKNMFRSLHTSSSVLHIKSTLNIQIIKGLLQCYSTVKNTFKNLYLTIFIAIKINLMNKASKTCYISY